MVTKGIRGSNEWPCSQRGGADSEMVEERCGKEEARPLRRSLTCDLLADAQANGHTEHGESEHNSTSWTDGSAAARRVSSQDLYNLCRARTANDGYPGPILGATGCLAEPSSGIFLQNNSIFRSLSVQRYKVSTWRGLLNRKAKKIGLRIS